MINYVCAWNLGLKGIDMLDSGLPLEKLILIFIPNSMKICGVHMSWCKFQEWVIICLDSKEN